MSAAIMNPPHRKPLPGYATGPAAYPTPSYNHLAAPHASEEDRTHARTRTNSSSVMPYPMGSTAAAMPAYNMPPQVPQHAQYPNQNGRRTLSTVTSNSSVNGPSGLSAQRTSTMSGYSTTSSVRRSTSSRSDGSTASPSSYVALMRKQKATVWCDRAQHEDPRILAAQRQAKLRAAAEVAGGHKHTSARMSTSSAGVVGGVRSKIRHHGAPKASAYSGSHLGGAGVPMRLSASEVDENDSDDDTGSPRYHSRTGSGRSSLGSGRKGTFPGSSQQLYPTHSNGSTPPVAYGSGPGEMADLMEEQTPVPAMYEADDYFTHHGGRGGSGSSGEREDNFGTVGGLPRQPGKIKPEEQVARKLSNADDLRRRGSVDDRTMTMSAGRLFVANPDLSD